MATNCFTTLIEAAAYAASLSCSKNITEPDANHERSFRYHVHHLHFISGKQEDESSHPVPVQLQHVHIYRFGQVK